MTRRAQSMSICSTWSSATLGSPELGDSEKLSDSLESTQHIPAFSGSHDAHQRAGRGHHWPVLACPGESTLCPCGDLPTKQSDLLRSPHSWPLSTLGPWEQGHGRPLKSWGPHPVMAPTLAFPGLHGMGVLFAGELLPQYQQGPDSSRGARTVP